MISVHFRWERVDGFYRVRVTNVQNAEHADDLVATLCYHDEPGAAPSAAATPARRRLTVAQLVAIRDAALDKELRKLHPGPTAKVLALPRRATPKAP